MAGFVLPDLGDPDRLGVGGVAGNDVAETARHARHAVQQDADQLVPRPWFTHDPSNESEHHSCIPFPTTNLHQPAAVPASGAEQPMNATISGDEPSARTGPAGPG